MHFVVHVDIHIPGRAFHHSHGGGVEPDILPVHLVVHWCAVSFTKVNDFFIWDRHGYILEGYSDNILQNFLNTDFIILESVAT